MLYEVITEISAAAEQFVRKISGSGKPSNANQAAFDKAVAEISASSRQLLASLVTSAPPKNREFEAARRRERAAKRFGTAV